MSVSSQTGVFALLLSGLALLGGCNKNAPSSEAPREYPEDIASVEEALAVNAKRLRSSGIAVADPAPPAEPSADPAPSTLAGEAAAETDTTVEEAGANTVVSEDEDAAGDDQYAPPASAPPEPMDEPEADDRDSPGISLRERNLSRRREKKAKADRCERICDLAAATCDLADHICALAQRHPDEPRYEDACDRASNQCEVAAAACDECVK